VKEERELENIYNLISSKVDYVNLDLDGKLSWKSTSSWDGDLEQDLENWKNLDV